MKGIKTLLIFIVMSMVLTDIADYSKIIHTGLTIIGKLNPKAKIATILIGAIFDFIVGGGEDPNVQILKAIEDLRNEIVISLNNIEKEIGEIGLDILNEIKGSIYINGLGKELDILYSQLNIIANSMKTINQSTTYTEKEKLVEIAYLIGNNADWMKEGNMVFNIMKLAEVLAGNTFIEMENRDIYQIVYDANIPNSMFSGEANDYSTPYIEKVMQTYYYGSGAILSCLENAILVSNFFSRRYRSSFSFSKRTLLCLCNWRYCSY